MVAEPEIELATVSLPCHRGWHRRALTSTTVDARRPPPQPLPGSLRRHGRSSVQANREARLERVRIDVRVEHRVLELGAASESKKTRTRPVSTTIVGPASLSVPRSLPSITGSLSQRIRKHRCLFTPSDAVSAGPAVGQPCDISDELVVDVGVGDDDAAAAVAVADGDCGALFVVSETYVCLTAARVWECPRGTESLGSGGETIPSRPSAAGPATSRSLRKRRPSRRSRERGSLSRTRPRHRGYRPDTIE